MEKKSKQGTLVLIGILTADLFTAWLIGPFIYGVVPLTGH